MSKVKYQNPFSATFNGIIDLFKKQTPIGQLEDNQRLDGKYCLVTGANSGLGYAIAVQLLERGAHVILVCRSQIEETRKNLLKQFNANRFRILSVNLADFNSIDNLMDELVSLDLKLDVAVFNAAMVPAGAKKLESGFDEMFQVNYLSKFYLVNGLLERNVFNETREFPARIIFISSESHRTNRTIDIEKIGVFEEYNMSKVIDLYGYYKLLLNTFAVELAKRIEEKKRQIDVFAMCPGPVNSNIARKAPSFIQPILKLVFSLFFSSPAKAAKPAIYLAVSPTISKQKYLYLHLMQKKAMDEKALDKNNGKALWEKSQILISNSR